MWIVLLLYTVILYYITFSVVNACMLSAKQTKLKNKVTPINFDRLTLHDLVKLCIVPQPHACRYTVLITKAFLCNRPCSSGVAIGHV